MPVSGVYRGKPRPAAAGRARTRAGRGTPAAYTEARVDHPDREPGPAAAWLDEGEVNPEWTPPAGDPIHPSRVRRGLVYGARAALRWPWSSGCSTSPAGSRSGPTCWSRSRPAHLIVTGPYELRFTEATAQPETDADGKLEGWEVVAIGQARNTGDETMAPSVFGNDSVFAVKDPAQRR